MLEKTISEPWYTHVKNSKKIVEGRLYDSKLEDQLKIDPIIKFWNNDKTEFVIVQVLKLTTYLTFEEMLNTEGLDNVLPNVETIKEGIAIYREYYSDEEEMERNVLAISLKKL